MLNDSDGSNKWFTNNNSAWITFDFGEVEYTIDQIGFRSANDRPERNPDTVEIFHFENSLSCETLGEDCWVSLGTYVLDFQDLFHHVVSVDFPSTVTTGKMKFSFENQSTQMQLNQILLYRVAL